MNNKSIIITGANGAIGSFFTQEYLKLGYDVFALIHKHTERIAPLQTEYPHKLIVKKCDLTDYDQVQVSLQDFQTKYDYLPGKLIHTSALRSSDFKPLVESNPQQWSSIIEMNILSAYNLLRNILPFYQKNKAGRIILIGSNISRTGLKNGSAYAVSKGALPNLARTLAQENGPDNIMINVVSPGPVNADQSHFSQEYRKFRESYFQKELRETPLQKLVEPLDIFKTCDFLLSKENRMITGEEIFITGGKL